MNSDHIAIDWDGLTRRCPFRVVFTDAAARELRRLAAEVREEADRVMPPPRDLFRRQPIRVVAEQGEPIRDQPPRAIEAGPA